MNASMTEVCSKKARSTISSIVGNKFSHSKNSYVYADSLSSASPII